MGLQVSLLAQDKYDLTGNLVFDVSSQNGAVNTAAITIGNAGLGEYPAIMTTDATVPSHTLYMPKDLSPFGTKAKLPVVVYGNGGCRNGSMEVRNFLTEIASHGYLVIAVGPIKNALFGVSQTDSQASDPQLLIDGIDWATQVNFDDNSIFYGRIDTENVAVMGQSCGGLMAIGASKDERVTTVVMLNSGILEAAPETSREGAPPVGALPSTPKSYLETMKPSIAYFVGGETDMATTNANDDFTYINSVPVVVASYDFSDVKAENAFGYGHYPATYLEDNGGDFAVASVAWLNWQLKNDSKSAKVFTGNPCGLLDNPKWEITKKNID